jgi:hypothetical protein
MGMDILPHRPVVATFKTRFWNSMKLKVKKLVKDNFGDSFWSQS